MRNLCCLLLFMTVTCCLSAQDLRIAASSSDSIAVRSIPVQKAQLTTERSVRKMINIRQTKKRVAIHPAGIWMAKSPRTNALYAKCMAKEQ
ncbi:MAG: hypothetical protein MRY78_14140 [Saprospiraceae bacterium]|nr:hypothetical protein [Saprospiraceae bacterium]